MGRSILTSLVDDERTFGSATSFLSLTVFFFLNETVILLSFESFHAIFILTAFLILLLLPWLFCTRISTVVQVLYIRGNQHFHFIIPFIKLHLFIFLEQCLLGLFYGCVLHGSVLQVMYQRGELIFFA